MWYAYLLASLHLPSHVFQAQRIRSSGMVKLRLEQLYFDGGSDSDMVSTPHPALRVRPLSR